MEEAYKLQVPTIVDIGIGSNWLEAHWYTRMIITYFYIIAYHKYFFYVQFLR
jgi:hypothetical protein